MIQIVLLATSVLAKETTICSIHLTHLVYARHFDRFKTYDCKKSHILKSICVCATAIRTWPYGLIRSPNISLKQRETPEQHQRCIHEATCDGDNRTNIRSYVRNFVPKQPKFGIIYKVRISKVLTHLVWQVWRQRSEVERIGFFIVRYLFQVELQLQPWCALAFVHTITRDGDPIHVAMEHIAISIWHDYGYKQQQQHHQV